MSAVRGLADKPRHTKYIEDEDIQAAQSLTGHAPLPNPSQTPHVTLSGGTLSGFDVVRAEDTDMATPEKVELGARVQLVDGRIGKVTELKGRRLMKFGVLRGEAMIKLDGGGTVRASSGSIAAVLQRP